MMLETILSIFFALLFICAGIAAVVENVTKKKNDD